MTQLPALYWLLLSPLEGGIVNYPQRLLHRITAYHNIIYRERGELCWVVTGVLLNTLIGSQLGVVT